MNTRIESQPILKRVTQPIDLGYARNVLRCEATAVASLEQRIGADFVRAAELILQLEQGGRIVVTGMGKAGLMGAKIAATFASTGTPALFMHPAEAVHGDLGMVTKPDIVLAVSNSGETDEILRLIPTLRRIQCRIISITGQKTSSLSRVSDVTLEIGKLDEPCPLRMAPSASTTALLALGDALALTVLKARGFTQDDFALLHPAGSIGRKLLKVADAMRREDRMVKVGAEVTVGEALTLMAKPPRNGAAVVVDKDGGLSGIFTHGDFARLVLKSPETLQQQIGKLMTSPCRSIQADALVADAQQMMHQYKINALPVIDLEKRVVGLLDIQDLV